MIQEMIQDERIGKNHHYLKDTLKLKHSQKPNLNRTCIVSCCGFKTCILIAFKSPKLTR